MRLYSCSRLASPGPTSEFAWTSTSSRGPSSHHPTSFRKTATPPEKTPSVVSTPAPAPDATAPPNPQATSPAFDPIRDFYNAPDQKGAPAPSTKAAPEPARDPYRIDPARYLKRLLDYEVTHADGFVAVDRDCKGRIEVELYALESGWTVFARSTRNGREEKVDHVEIDEFEALAQRVVRALLHDRPIDETITRENVLRADSEHAVRTVRGRGHAVFALGGAVRVGELPTAEDPEQPVSETLEVLTPFDVQLGYRLKSRSWGLDAFARLNIGTKNTALRSNQTGGQVDYGGSGALGLHFLRYLDAPGVASLYFGGGASVELSWFNVIKPVDARGESDRSYLVGGGLNVDAFIGCEFLRASAMHFFTQLEIGIPTYALKTENASGGLHTYFPGGLAQIGVIL